MSAVSFATKNETWRHLIGNGLSYVIPRFQRDYSWSRDEWDDLWQDIQGTLDPSGEPAHYMGYLVLQTKENRSFEVIDGQQRLTTLSLLALAVLKVLQDLVDPNVDADNDRRRSDQLRNSFIPPLPLRGTSPASSGCSPSARRGAANLNGSLQIRSTYCSPSP